MTTPGNKTVFRKERIEIVSGSDSFFMASSSSVVIRGINSEFSSKSCNDKLSSIVNFDLLIGILGHSVIKQN